MKRFYVTVVHIIADFNDAGFIQAFNLQFTRIK